MIRASRGIKAYHRKLARIELWAAAIFCGLAGCMSVYKPAVVDGRWIALTNTPVTDATGWWAAAVVLAAAAQWVGRGRPIVGIVGWRPAPVTGSSGVRWHCLFTSIPFLAGAFFLQESNRYTVIGVTGWAVGVGLVVAAFVPRGAGPLAMLAECWRTIRRYPAAYPRTTAALLLILAFGAFARFRDLDRLPPELTGDHVEKMGDIQSMLEGNHAIYFGPQGDRESFHIYFAGLLAALTGGVTFTTLKVAAALESVAGLVALYGFGQSLIGDGSRRARMLALCVALAGAVGYWHLVVTRASLRIMLAPLVTSVLLWALIRLLRHNRRRDAIWAGLTIGFGFYAYQALRVTPALAVIAVALGVIWSWRDRAARRRYVEHLIIIGLVAFAVGLPMMRYAVDNWNSYWVRLSSVVQGPRERCSAPNGDNCEMAPDAFQRFASQLGTTTLMFTYRSDQAWTYNAPGFPALDPLAGVLLLAGGGAWAVRGVRRRDPVSLLVLLALVAMLTPSAVALGRPEENPSNIRTSGAMPMVYALVGFGLYRSARLAAGVFRPGLRSAVRLVVPAAAGIVMYAVAWQVLSGPYEFHHQIGPVSHRELGQVMGEIAEEVGWGNVYLISRPYEMDVRALEIQAGITPGHYLPIDIWPHVLPERLYENWLDIKTLDLDVTRDIYIVYSYRDDDTTTKLREWFPDGELTEFWTRQDKPWLETEPSRIYRVPAPGDQGIVAFFRKHLDPVVVRQ